MRTRPRLVCLTWVFSVLASCGGSVESGDAARAVDDAALSSILDPETIGVADEEGALEAAAADKRWTKTMSTSFDKKAAAGKVGEVYSNELSVYTDTYCTPKQPNCYAYRKDNLSVHDGYLDIDFSDLQTGGAFFFRPKPGENGQTYGRFVIKFRAVKATGHGAAIMLWPTQQPEESSKDAWSRGEIDFPEGTFDYTMKGFHHTTDPKQCGDKNGCNEAIAMDTEQSWRKVNVAEIRWVPGRVSYYMNGKRIATITKHPPVGPHRFTVQAGPRWFEDKFSKGRLEIRYVALYALKPEYQ